MDINQKKQPNSASQSELDVEHLKKAAQSVYERNAELIKIDRMKDEFVALASHELRTPLTIIKNYLWLAIHQKEDHLNEKTLKYIEIALHTADRLMFLVEDILTISRIENGRISLAREDVDIIALIRDIVEEYGVKAKEKHVTISFNPTMQSQIVRIDKNRFHQVVVNILGNAIKFTPDNGLIRFEVGIQNSTTFELKITDSGPGIPTEKQDKLFTKFGKIDESYANLPNINGTGLGLYISQEIMKLHGGSITVESEYGHGATFIVHLPIGE